MKRTTLMLNSELLEEARRELGARTYSEAVNRSMQEAIRRQRILGMRKLFGTGFWQGDLAEMRRDRFPAPPAEKPPAARRRSATARSGR